jgi:hypothetical protein
MKKGELSKIRSKPGQSNAYKYKDVKSFAGPNHTFPINTPARARNALARAHFAANPSAVKAKVHKKYPSIGKPQRGKKA